MEASGGGDGARSLIGLTLLSLGRNGEGFRAARVALPVAVHLVSEERDGEAAADASCAGVANNFAMSYGLNGAGFGVDAFGVPEAVAIGVDNKGRLPGWMDDTGKGCCRTPVGVCALTVKGCSITPPRFGLNPEGVTGGGCDA
jgi:hypothetical protein